MCRPKQIPLKMFLLVEQNIQWETYCITVSLSNCKLFHRSCIIHNTSTSSFIDIETSNPAKTDWLNTDQDQHTLIWVSQVWESHLKYYKTSRHKAGELSSFITNFTLCKTTSKLLTQGNSCLLRGIFLISYRNRNFLAKESQQRILMGTFCKNCFALRHNKSSLHEIN